MILLCYLFVFISLTFANQQAFVPEHIPNSIPTYNVPRPSSILSSRAASTKPYQFAVSIHTSIYIHPSSSLITAANQSIRQWKIKIYSPGALSLSLVFDQWQVPPSAAVHIVGENDRVQSLNSFSNATRLATRPVVGNTLYVVYETSFFQPLPYLHIIRVVHGFLPIPFLNSASFFDFNQHVISSLGSSRSGRCNIDYACDAIGSEWSKEASSIAILLTHENQRYCTGAFINNIEQDGRQLLLTANHCIDNVSNLMTDMVLLNYQKPSCTSSNGFKRKLDILRGLVWQNSSNISDYAIFEVQERIPDEYNVFLAGWTTEAQPNWPLTGIHHPHGDFKKLSVYNSPLKPSCWDECPHKSHWKVDRWTRGTTESGSSGSPLFDADHRIVGQLHGGQAACWNKNGYDMYGSFKKSWYLGLSKILDPYARSLNKHPAKMDGIYLNTIREATKTKPLLTNQMRCK